ncbi:hypothetical protein L486_05674 [Kwoniella mangroviensis CBS 10435]|uniref:F-box domain-containing protein n=1 Tax=Kwoniella mangroviensis CBS 10435 TaxID=1331196 RepID=A0A1B9IML2_9TREE|nr:hypothetical protein L486_05674 [Kwoniella mangroviensis CBS 10435]
MNDPSNPFHVPSSSSSSASASQSLKPKKQLLSKIGQPSSSSPRTELNNRKRFGGLFASFGLGNGTGSPLRAPLGTPIRSERRHETFQPGDDVQEDSSGKGAIGGVWSFAEKMKELTLTVGSPARNRNKEKVREDTDEWEGEGLMGLHDEILLHILLQLPPTLSQLHIISRVSTRFYDLSRTPVLWLRIFHEAGFDLNEHAQQNGVAVEYPPEGHWEGKEWIHRQPQAEGSSDNPNSNEPPEDDTGEEEEEEDSVKDSTPIHYPTLVRSRYIVQHLILDSDHLPTPTRLRGHKDVVYCLAQWRNYLFTGSRDRSIRLYDLSTGECIWVDSEAHGRSVLCLDLDIDEDGKGTLVSGSSDMIIGIYTIDLPPPSLSSSSLAVGKRLNTIRCESSILSIGLTPRYLLSANKDTKIHIYDRKTHELVITLEGHTQPINSISLSPRKDKLVSGSGDGSWKIWDIASGLIEREGGGGRGVACVEWNHDHIVTGDGDNLVKLYSSSNGQLISTFQGHTDLVRSVTISKSAGVVVSASYDKSIRIWDIKTGKLIKIINEDRSSLVFNLKMVSNKIIA